MIVKIKIRLNVHAEKLMLSACSVYLHSAPVYLHSAPSGSFAIESWKLSRRGTRAGDHQLGSIY